MPDLERIGSLIADIKRYLKELESYKLNKEDLSNSKNYHASSMIIFAILNRIIDLGNEIIAMESLQAPRTYNEITEILRKGGIINKEQEEDLSNLIKKRNIFAHFYEDITEKELFKTIKEIPKIESFLNTIKKRVELK
jgi:uncharacterized protein YutE (UPF0331/DUF86 family)